MPAKQDVKMVKVVATAQGFYGGTIREAGDVFEVPEGAEATWFEKVAESK